ncbi:uncharacterized protein TRIVIDRAFT_62272 [Trichoderma virens Gv29-8]|uniref:Uncharacterized protein n=1 Tax=Hypocrea virens (strain Gv29-8 / FGSC 10586) TaxID=413071 RepID=G9MJD9_HYPVG|nr:uncharacterized protein TRIVIDRAFT_62272 [Trichoderma virens Gv29-8]EHK25602.1 hypothetical protein TRIVIDRAFT_62272 [Trichoderma virens Gv29-8]UKZ48578.1 hypothetical protein TrVGV298_002803 [Trichoderma virens]
MARSAALYEHQAFEGISGGGAFDLWQPKGPTCQSASILLRIINQSIHSIHLSRSLDNAHSKTKNPLHNSLRPIGRFSQLPQSPNRLPQTRTLGASPQPRLVRAVPIRLVLMTQSARQVMPLYEKWAGWRYG